MSIAKQIRKGLVWTLEFQENMNNTVSILKHCYDAGALPPKEGEFIYQLVTDVDDKAHKLKLAVCLDGDDATFPFDGISAERWRIRRVHNVKHVYSYN